MLAKADGTHAASFVPDLFPAVADRTEPRRCRIGLRGIAIIFTTNTTLFCALDMAQWVAERYALSTLPTNLIAALIATALGLAFAALGLGDGDPSPAQTACRSRPDAADALNG